MIRDLIQQQINQVIANQLPDNYYADPWQSQVFSVFFPQFELTSPYTDDEDSEFKVISNFRGTVVIQLQSNTEEMPDPLSLMLYLQDNPFLLTPPADAIDGKIYIKTLIRFNEFRDVISDDNRYITELIGKFDSHCCSILRKVTLTPIPQTLYINE